MAAQTADGLIDLHSHSLASDGQYAAAEVATRAAAAGVRVWALCDHDTVAGLAGRAAGRRALGVRFVPGHRAVGVPRSPRDPPARPLRRPRAPRR